MRSACGVPRVTPHTMVFGTHGIKSDCLRGEFTPFPPHYKRHMMGTDYEPTTGCPTRGRAPRSREASVPVPPERREPEPPALTDPPEPSAEPTPPFYRHSSALHSFHRSNPAFRPARSASGVLQLRFPLLVASVFLRVQNTRSWWQVAVKAPATPVLHRFPPGPLLSSRLTLAVALGSGFSPRPYGPGAFRHDPSLPLRQPEPYEAVSGL